MSVHCYVIQTVAARL